MRDVKWKRGIVALLVLSATSIVATAFAQEDKGHRDEVIKFMDEVWNKGNLAYIDTAVDPQITRFGHTDEGNVSGIEAYKNRVKQIRSAFTDYNVTLLDMTGIGDTATFRWQLRGNYVGPDQKITPGRSVDLIGKTVWTMRDHKVVREVVELNGDEYYRQIQMAKPYSEVGNRALMLSYLYEVVSRGEVSSLDVLVSEKHVLHDLGSDKIVGQEALREHVVALRAAFPDLMVKIHEVIADGNNVSARWTLEGTQKGEWNGIPATNRKIVATGVTFMTMKDNKIQETWSSLDTMALGAKAKP